MTMKLTTKLSPLFIALSIASANLYAGELTSFTSEVKLNDYKEGAQKTEFTIGKGAYKINDTFKFLFDVDKDYTAKDDSDADSVAKEGWDTQFGIAQSVGSIAGMDLTLYYLARYDSSWEASTGADTNYVAQYIISPIFDTSFKIADNDYYLTIELWAQGGEKNGGTLQKYSGAETNFYFGGPLSDNWSFDLAWYNFDYYDGEEYVYQIGTEDTLTYSLALNDNVTFELEGYYAGYYTPDTEEKADIEGHVKPAIKYKKKLGEDFSLHASIGYEVVSYENFGTSTWSNNELEITAGFSF